MESKESTKEGTMKRIRNPFSIRKFILRKIKDLKKKRRQLKFLLKFSA